MPSFDFKRLPVLDNTELFSSENENDYFPFHFHDYYCVSLITKGTELLHNTAQEFIAPTGSVSITQANEVHRNYALSSTGYSYKTIYVNPDVLAFCNNGKQIPALERIIYDAPLFNLFLQLFNLDHNTPVLLEKSITRLAGYAARPYESHPFEKNFATIDEIIETYPDKPIDTDWLCGKFHMSKYHFIRSFKKAKGITPQSYIMLQRLGKAKKLVLAGTPLKEIAYQFGFHDASHFTHSFRKYFGVPPSHYQQA